MRLHFAALLYAALLPAAYAEISWSVDPRLEGGSPSITVTGVPEDSELTFRVVNIFGDVPIITDEITRAGSGTHQFVFPRVDETTYVRLFAWINRETEDSTPNFVWSTVLRPGRLSLYTFYGDKSMRAPDDFLDFWQRAVDELDEVPMEPVVTRLGWGETETAFLEEVILESVGGVRFVSRITIPKAAYDESGNVVKTFPAVIVMPGYGAEQPGMDRTPSGLITMSVNPRHHGPSRQLWESPVPHLLYNIEDPENYYYRSAYLDNLRAAQYLFTRPEVDVTRVGAEGGSQGGLFAIALAALEPRISLVVSNVTALSAIPDGLRLNQAGTTQTIRRRIEQQSLDGIAVRRTLSYIDGANMALLVRVPIQINMGDQDHLCHFLTGLVVLHSLRVDVPREYRLFRNVRHAVPPEMRQANGEWMRMWWNLPEAPSLPGRLLYPPPPDDQEPSIPPPLF